MTTYYSVKKTFFLLAQPHAPFDEFVDSLQDKSSSCYPFEADNSFNDYLNRVINKILIMGGFKETFAFVSVWLTK